MMYPDCKCRSRQKNNQRAINPGKHRFMNAPKRKAAVHPILKKEYIMGFYGSSSPDKQYGFAGPKLNKSFIRQVAAPNFL